MVRADFVLSLKFAVLLGLVLSLVACSGEEVVEFEEDAAGILAGGYRVVVSDSGGNSSDVIGFMGPSGDLVVIEGFLNLTMAELEFASDGAVSGAGLIVLSRDSESEWSTIEVALDGSSESANSVRLNVSDADGDEVSSIAMDRDDSFSDLGVTLEEVEGTYMMSGSDVRDATVTVDINGNLSGADGSGCIYSGQVAIPDESINLIEVSYNAANCTDSIYNGNFFALGVFDMADSELIFAGTNEKVATVFVGER